MISARCRLGGSRPTRRLRRAARPRIGAVAIVALTAAGVAGCGGSSVRTGASGPIPAVGAENEYANVIEQVGGRYVKVTAIESDPATDPHTYEASPSVAEAVGTSPLVVQNGVGYDTYMERIESASPSPARRVIDVQRLLGLPDSTPNPHLWYRPQTMGLVAHAIAADLSAIQPAHAAYFRANAGAFEASLAPWQEALKRFAAEYPNTPVAVSEPVVDYMLEAAGARILTPFALQAKVMNGVDPAPQDVTLQNGLLSHRKVKAMLYNQQVTDTLTQSFLAAAKRNGVPVVGVYETMPTPGYDYQSWMLAEVQALRRAVAERISTQRL